MNKMMALVVMGMLFASLFSGCATLKGTDEAQQVRNTIDAWTKALVAQDVDAFMSVYSEDFKHETVPDKAGMREAFQSSVDNGNSDSAEVNLEKLAIAIEGDSATVTGIEVSTIEGTSTFNFVMKKESDGAWRIIGMEIAPV